MQYTISGQAPNAIELGEFYLHAGWIKEVDYKKMQRAVDSTSEWFVARNEHNVVIGIGRFITDYARYAFVVDIIVSEKQRGKGIGSDITQAIVQRCRELQLDSVNLWPSKGKAAFYQRFGFQPLEADQPHMKLQNPD